MKRIFDFFVASIALTILMIPILVLIGLVRINLGSPVFFKQKRPGLGGKVFEMIKFRTMTEEKDSEGKLLPDFARITKFGYFMRTTSLDELPELWNVIKGEMSLVGPRPLLIDYLELYTKEQARRHEVRPGITGWAQINGRNAISWQEKFDFDIWYVDNNSIWLDLKIIFFTLKKIFNKEGIDAEKNVTMPTFTGSDL